MACPKCKSERTARVSAKCSDLCSFQAGQIETNDYVPDKMGIGGGDYVRFEYCLDCGQMLGQFPIPQERVDALAAHGDEWGR